MGNQIDQLHGGLQSDVNNKIIIQFGTYITGTNYLPISYTKFYAIASSGEYSWSGSDTYIYDTKLNQFMAKLSRQDWAHQYISIGI